MDGEKKYVLAGVTFNEMASQNNWKVQWYLFYDHAEQIKGSLKENKHFA